MKSLITVIAPMYNEEALVEAFASKTKATLSELENQYDFEILFVNDGSKDMTLQQMNKVYKADSKHISIINLTRNFGLEGAIFAGISKAKGDIVVAMDADLQDPPSVILKMIKEYEQGADIVIANRKKRLNDNRFKRLSAQFYYKVLGDLSGKIHLERGAANFRLLSRRAVNQLKALPEVNGVFRVTVPFLGMKTAVVEYERDKRYAGNTKYNFKSMIRYALDSITGISVEPLRKISWFVILAGIFLLGNIIGIAVNDGDWRKIFYLGSVISFLFLCAFSIMTLMGEYIAQIMIEVKGRPTSLIYDYLQSDLAKEREI